MSLMNYVGLRNPTFDEARGGDGRLTANGVGRDGEVGSGVLVERLRREIAGRPRQSSVLCQRLPSALTAPSSVSIE